jgi:DNA mismatch endonuclease (patch repair protein)
VAEAVVEVVARRVGKSKASMSRVSWASSVATRKSMRANRRRDTGAELAIRRAVWMRGLRYRVDMRVLSEVPRRADIVFIAERVAIFVDGCFWHMCPLHRSIPATNREFWVAKLTANRRRDSDTDRRLVADGWLPVRVWAHADPNDAAQMIAELLRTRRVARVGDRISSKLRSQPVSLTT